MRPGCSGRPSFLWGTGQIVFGSRLCLSEGLGSKSMLLAKAVELALAEHDLEA